MDSGIRNVGGAGASVLWQTGKLYSDECQEFAAPLMEKWSSERLQVMPFVSRMDLVYRGASILVSRAGASTISEIQLTGVPSVLIPSPNVAEDHQRHNAMALADRGAAVMILDKDAREQLGDTVVNLLGDEERLRSIGRDALKMALPGSDDKIVDRIVSLIKK